MKSPRNIIIVSCKSLIIVTMPVKPLACVAQYRFRNFIFTFHNCSPGANGLSFTIGTSFVKKEQLVSNRSDRCEFCNMFTVDVVCALITENQPYLARTFCSTWTPTFDETSKGYMTVWNHRVSSASPSLTANWSCVSKQNGAPV